MSLKQANKTSFKTGWIGVKSCFVCKEAFIANSGSQKACSNCRKCKECSKSLRYSHQTFCNNSCSGKWKVRNLPQCDTLKQNSKKANTKEAIEKRVLKIKGKPRLSIRGSNHYNWSGGISRKERHTLMGRIEYKNWRKAVFERDNYTCVSCGIRGGYLEADHIIPYFLDKTMALDLDNGQTLCKECHKKTKTYGYKVKKLSIKDLVCRA